MNRIDMLTGEIRFLLSIKVKYSDFDEQQRVQERIDGNWILIEYLTSNKGE